jgi:antitoxin YxxD
MFEAIRRLMVDGATNPDHPNVFYPVTDAEIATSEQRLGYELPQQLQTFHREVGYGFFKSSSPESRGSEYNYINRFLAPSQVADLLLGNDEEVMPSEGFDDGEIPFFEVGDRLYLVLRPNSSHSAQVCWPYGDKVSDDLIEFTERLALNPRCYHGA